jgi:hypothetical protein
MSLQMNVLKWTLKSLVATIAFSAAGVHSNAATIEWVKSLSMADHISAYGVAADLQGNVFLAGGSETYLPAAPFVIANQYVMSYTANGDFRWQQSVSGSPTYSNTLAAGPNGSVFLTGITNSSIGRISDGSPDPVVVKFNSAGNQQWAWQSTSPNFELSAISAVDSQGNVFVVGKETFAPKTVFLTKLDSSGAFAWKSTLGATIDDEGMRVDVDSQGNTYVVGGTFGDLAGVPNAGSRDVFVSKFDSSGASLWTRQFGTSGNDIPYGGVKIDSSGNFYVSGYTTGSIEAFLLKYDASGNELWIRQFSGDIRDMAIDYAGNIFLTGGIGLVEYSPSGDLLWTYDPNPIGVNFSPEAVTLDNTGNLYLAGIGTYGPNFVSGAHLVKISGIPVPEPISVVHLATGALFILRWRGNSKVVS